LHSHELTIWEGKMGRFILRRLVFFVITLFVTSVLIFTLIRAAGGNVAAILLGKNSSAEEIQKLSTELGLERPLPVQYFEWITNFLQGDLGQAFRSKQEASHLIWTQAPVSVPLSLGGLLLAIIIAIPFGTYAAKNFNKPSGAFVALLSQFGIAIPVFWAGLLLSLVFGVYLGVLPTGGWVPWSENWVGSLRSLVLPVFTLGIVMAATLTRYTRTAILDVMNEDFVRTARASGMSLRVALIKVGLRNASLPLVTVLGLLAAEMVGGTVIIEKVYSLPGISRMILDNVTAREVVVVQSTVMVIVIYVMTVNLIIDLVYGLLDPRIRIGK
jgi:peptide/nickel transport system permease protein